MRHVPTDRKNDALSESARYLAGGLLLALATACFLFRDAAGKLDAAGADMIVKLFGLYALALTGKLAAFNYGSAKEDAAAAPPKP